MSTTTQARTDWLAARKHGIGGSDAAAVCGLSKYKTPLQVYLDKIGEAPDEPENAAMARGRLLEPALRQWYADETGRMVMTPKDIVRHPVHDWAIASLDGIASNEIVVDFKTARSRAGWGDPGTPEVPQEYLVQVTHYMLVTGMTRAELAVLFGNFEFAIYPVEYDAELADMILAAEREFWARVEARQPPEPMDLEDIKRRWPKSVGKPIAATDAVAVACTRLAGLKRELKAIEEERASQESIIRGFMGEHDTLLLGEGSAATLATWKNCKVNPKFDAKRLRDERPDVYEHYLSDGKPQRRFLLKGESNGNGD